MLTSSSPVARQSLTALRRPSRMLPTPSAPAPAPRPVFCPRSSSSPEPSISGQEDFYFMTEEEIEAERQRTIKEYEALKEMINGRTIRFGGGLAAYLALVASSQAALLSLVGMGASMLYLQLLYRDVDSYQAGQTVQIFEIEQNERRGIGKNFKKALLAYPQALRPRLLVLVALAVAYYGWNLVAEPEARLGPVELGALLGGFLSYKVSLLLLLYDDLKPKPEDTAGPAARPVLPDIEDLTEKVELKNPNIIKRMNSKL